MIKTILAVLCFVNVAIAQDAPTAGSYRDFSGGLNTYNASVALPANESPNLMNVVIDEAGALTQRNGFQSCGQIPSGATATNLYEYVKNDGSRNLIVTDNETIWQTADCVVYSTITTGLSSLSMPRFTTALDKLWVVNGSTYPFTWDGSTLYRLDGLDNHPEAPKGKYITYWKSRVWVADTPTAPSSVYFSLLVDSLGNILSPETSTGAWTSTNQIYFNRDDGSPVYGMKAYRDNLYVFKETGISRLIFESEYSLSVAKNVSTIGSKFNESIIEMDDGLLRFVGRDGVYAFDGSTVKRLSTRWTPTFETIRQPSQSEQYHLWDSNSDFIKGSYFNIFSSTPNSINLSSFSLSNFFTEDFSKYSFLTTTNTMTNPSWYGYSLGGGRSYVTTNNFTDFSQTTSGERYAAIVSTDFIHKSTTGFTLSFDASMGVAPSSLLNGSVSLGALYSSPGFSQGLNSKFGYQATLYRGSPGTTPIVSGQKCATYDGIDTCLAPSVCKISLPTNTFSAHVSIRVETNGDIYLSTGGPNTYCPSSSFFSGYTVTNDHREINYIAVDMHEQNVTGANTAYTNITNISVSSNGYNSPGIFTSEITTATNVSVWKTFAVDETLNGQSIAYDIRTATSVYNTLQAPWRSITSGAVVSTTTDAYAQWRATLGTTDNGVTPLVNSASIGWMTGGSSKSTMYGINYKSRYWLAASTSIANQYNDLVMVESKAQLGGTHTRYNLPISAFAIWNGNLYGAIGNTPKIARLDYGSTDDGNAIMSWWDSRDEMYDNPILYKTINLGILDYANSPGNTNIQIGLSPDMGENWEYKAFNMAASTLPRNTKRLNYTANTALGFRTRIFNDTLGIGFKIYGIHNFGKMTQFAGN